MRRPCLVPVYHGSHRHPRPDRACCQPAAAKQKAVQVGSLNGLLLLGEIGMLLRRQRKPHRAVSIVNMVTQCYLNVLQGIQDSLLVGLYFADADLQF